MDSAADSLKSEIKALIWAAERSQRYHSRRAAFFNRWNKATALVGVLGGSAVFASLGHLSPAIMGQIAAAIVVCMSGVDLVAGASEMARKHDDLRRRFCELEADIRRKVEPTVDDAARWFGCRLAIEADEPATYVALDLLCENQLRRAYGHHGEHGPRPVHPLKSATAQLFRWENTAA